MEWLFALLRKSERIGLEFTRLNRILSTSYGNGRSGLFNPVFRPSTLRLRICRSLVMYDRSMSTSLNRGTTIPDESQVFSRCGHSLPVDDLTDSYDLELPLVVNDGDWDLTKPENNFPLKAGGPSSQEPGEMAYFVCKTKQCLILGIATRTIYAANRSKVLMGTSRRRRWSVRR